MVLLHRLSWSLATKAVKPSRAHASEEDSSAESKLNLSEGSSHVSDSIVTSSVQ